MHWAMADAPHGAVTVCPVAPDGTPAGPSHSYPHPADAVRHHHPVADRWIWSATADFYPRLLDAGVTVPRCYDVEAAEAILLGHEGLWGLPRSLAAAWARLRGLPVPEDRPPRSFAGEPAPTLFDAAPAAPHGADPLQALLAVHAAQQERISATAHPHRMRLLVAAESAGMLVAAEMHRAGLPWRAEVHDALLTELLGGRYPGGLEPPRLAELADEVSGAFGERVRPDLPADVVRAFRRAGVRITSTRKWELRGIDHPAVAPLLEYKKLYRLHTAHGWSWLQTWVHGGRFRPEYLPGGAMSGRWTTHGGGALQIPRVVRRAVVADAGWRLVVADADQLEPRVLAAVSGDRGLMAAADGTRDLYAALADRAFAGGRAEAKLALLGAIYGQTSGDALTYLADLRRRFPAAVAYVDEAARAGEEGRLVRSHLGRTCAPSDAADDGEAGLPQEDDGGGAQARGGAAARARGRFARNFVVQASAAEWALCLLAALRQELAGLRAELVFFQHDEVIVHCPAQEAPAVEKALTAASARAGEVVFGATPVVFSFTTAVVECYADAK
ncbi:bifunctional 3'-5' exonuclease/DNA polymerase [Streptomyces sp. MAR4 CNX-425]|uniref:bifunctional 3'-5' exonuclease/DNA polymerase n=1 Tax=Streptomyces sp. MAR4 CNX-425 TaxID=3406343 RepID=UPI003B5078D3